MMKPYFIIIAAAFFLAEETIAADSGKCDIQCVPLNGARNYTKETSLIVNIGSTSDVLYSVKLKVYAAITLKFNLAFATHGKILVIFNIKTGVYILLDHKTLFCIYGKTKITFLTSSNKVDYDKLISQSNEILEQYTSITRATKDSFDWQLIVNAFYSQNFDIKTIFTSKELVTVLQDNFAGWFAAIQKQIKARNILISCSYWGFLAVILDQDIKDSLNITEVLRAAITYHQELDTDFMVFLAHKAMHSFDAYRKATSKIAALAIIVGKIDKKLFMEYLKDSQYDVTVYQITIAKVGYEIKVYKVKNSYLIRFSILVNNINLRYDIAYINGVLSIINMQSNILLALQGSSVVVANKTSGLVLVADLSNNVKVKVSAFSNATFIQLTRDAHGVKVSEQVLVYIQKNNSSGHECNLQALIEAVIKGNIKRIGSLIGSTALAAEFITSFKVFLSTIKVTGLGKLSLCAFVLGAFGIEVKTNVIVKTVVQVLTNFVSKWKGFSAFLETFIKLLVDAGGGSRSG